MTLQNVRGRSAGQPHRRSTHSGAALALPDRRGRLIRTELPPRVIGLAHRRILGSAGAYTIALLLSLMVPVMSLALFLAVPLFNVLPFTLDRHFRAESP